MSIGKKILYARNLFRNGCFNEAEKIFHEVLENDPENFDALSHLGYIAHLSNNFIEAKKYLMKAIERRPEDKLPKLVLAYTFYREDMFTEALNLFKDIGINNFVEKLEVFQKIDPYKVLGDLGELKIIEIFPLLMVKVEIDGGREANFILDTGVDEVILDKRFAEEVCVEGESVYGWIDSMKLDNIVIRNVPISIRDLNEFSRLFSDKYVDGVIGLSLLYHLIPTIDFPKRKVVFRPKNREILRSLENVEKHIAIPFWTIDNHHIIAHGNVNEKRYLLYIDIGLPGGGFICPESTIREAGIQVREIGSKRASLFIIDRLSLGDMEERNVSGIFLKNFSIENILGLHIGGIISYSFFINHSITLDFIDMRILLKGM